MQQCISLLLSLRPAAAMLHGPAGSIVIAVPLYFTRGPSYTSSIISHKRKINVAFSAFRYDLTPPAVGLYVPVTAGGF